MMTKKPSFVLLFMLISFGSIAAVAYTPALPAIAQFFEVDEKAVSLTMTWFLVGYALGQLLYGPLANRFGRKKALYIGIVLEIIGALACVFSAAAHAFWLLVTGRLLMALGASVGLKMTFTLVNDAFSKDSAKKMVAHLMMAFAVTPALGVAVGGILIAHLSWIAIFYFMAGYGVVLALLTGMMSETATVLDGNALHYRVIVAKYGATLHNSRLVFAAILMGAGTAFVYVFASLAPFIAIPIMELTPKAYGLWNLLPSVGIILGSQLSAYYSQKLHPLKAIGLGIALMILGLAIMAAGLSGKHLDASFLFMPLLIIYIGLSFVFANSSSLAVANHEDKSNASAMMSFINMSVATLSVLLLGHLEVAPIRLLLMAYAVLIFLMVMFNLLLKIRNE